MNITPAELSKLNGSWVIVIDFTGAVYEGFLHYRPKDQFSVQIWSDGCCFITYLLPEDITFIHQTRPRLTPNVPPIHVRFFGLALPCLVKTSCCDRCLPEVILMDVIDAGSKYGCLTGDSYILEWDFIINKYQLNYPAICGYDLHAELMCAGADWVFSIHLIDRNELAVNGTNFDFPLDPNTLRGQGKVNLYQVARPEIKEEIITISFRPIG
jgi:hypothetical protein